MTTGPKHTADESDHLEDYIVLPTAVESDHLEDYIVLPTADESDGLEDYIVLPTPTAAADESDHLDEDIVLPTLTEDQAGAIIEKLVEGPAVRTIQYFFTLVNKHFSDLYNRSSEQFSVLVNAIRLAGPDQLIGVLKDQLHLSDDVLSQIQSELAEHGPTPARPAPVYVEPTPVHVAPTPVHVAPAHIPPMTGYPLKRVYAHAPVTEKPAFDFTTPAPKTTDFVFGGAPGGFDFTTPAPKTPAAKPLFDFAMPPVVGFGTPGKTASVRARDPMELDSKKPLAQSCFAVQPDQPIRLDFETELEQSKPVLSAFQLSLRAKSRTLAPKEAQRPLATTTPKDNTDMEEKSKAILNRIALLVAPR